MNWADPWHWLTLIALSVPGTALTLLAFFGLAPKILGEKFLSHILDRKLSKFKHEQDTEIEALKAKLARLGDRGIRSNEREYAAIITAWESFVDAYIATHQCVIRFMSHPNFSNMASDDLADYLTDTPPFRVPEKANDDR